MRIYINQQKIHNFFNAARSATVDRQYYTRIARHDFLSLNSSQFLCYSLIKKLANFHTQSVDFYSQKRYLRSQYHKRTVSRHLSHLERTGLIERIKPNEYGIVRNRRGRPVNLKFIHLVRDKETALLARFFLLLAYWHGNPQTLSIRRIREALGIDTNIAVQLHKWLVCSADNSRRRSIRKIIFFCQRPNWRQYRHSSRHQVNKVYNSMAAWRSDFANAGHSCLNNVYLFKKSNLYGKAEKRILFKPTDQTKKISQLQAQPHLLAQKQQTTSRKAENIASMREILENFVTGATQNATTGSQEILQKAKKPPGKPKTLMPWLDRSKPEDLKLLAFFISGLIFIYTSIAAPFFIGDTPELDNRKNMCN